MAKKPQQQKHPQGPPIDLEPVTKRVITGPNGESILVPDDGPVMGQQQRLFGRKKATGLARGAPTMGEGVLTQVLFNALNEWTEETGCSREQYAAKAVRTFLQENKGERDVVRGKVLRRIKGGVEEPTENDDKALYRRIRGIAVGKRKPGETGTKQSRFNDVISGVRVKSASAAELATSNKEVMDRHGSPDGLSGLPTKIRKGRDGRLRVKYTGKNVTPMSAEDDLRDHLARGRTVDPKGDGTVKWDKRIEFSVNPNEPLPDQRPSSPPEAPKKDDRKYIPSPKVRELKGKWLDAKDAEEYAYAKWRGYYTHANTRQRKGIISKIFHAPADIYNDVQKNRWDSKFDNRKRVLRGAAAAYADERKRDRQIQGYDESVLMKKVRNILGEEKRYHFMKSRRNEDQ